MNRAINYAAMAAVCLASECPAATEFMLSSVPTNLSDWKNAEFYVGDAAPTGASTDVVNIPEGMTVMVSGTDSGVLSFLGSIGKVAPKAGASLVIDVPTSASPLEYAGMVVGGEDSAAWFVKTGDGDLKLMNTDASAYRVNLHVAKGTVRLPPVAANTYNYYNRVLVDEGATIYTMAQGYWQLRGLAGAGLVTNDNSTACTIYCQYSDQPWLGEFSGAIGGKITISLRNGRMQLTGSSNALSSGVEITVATDSIWGGNTKGTLGLASLGMKANAVTSTGPGSSAVFQTSGTHSRMIYLGRGETSNRDFRLASGGECVIDGGLYGGLHLTGGFTKWSSTAVNPIVVLDGSNTLAACEFDMSVSQYEYNSIVHNYYIRKQGTGEWVFPANSRYKNTGVVEVRDGKLSFASLEEAGLACSVGYSTNLFFAGKNTTAANSRAPYAFLLGDGADADAKGIMEYTGAATALCTTRPVAIAGTGGFSTAVGAGALKICGITSADATGVNTLVLAGDGAADNWAADVTNGVGTVGVRKEGSGSWTLAGALDFSGPLEVCGGVLTVTNPAPAKYSHFRLMVKETAYGNDALREKYGPNGTKVWRTWGTDYLGISEIGLYGSDNNRYGLNLADGADYATLAPGEAAFGWHKAVSIQNGGAVSCMFDNRRASASGVWNGIQIACGRAPTLSDPSTWIPIDMRLSADVPAITHYDVCKSVDVNSAAGVLIGTAFALYGSVDDGLHWDLLGSETDAVGSNLGNTYSWTQSGIGFADGETTAHSAGWTVRSAPTPRTGQFANISGVTVSGGATLRFLGPNAPALAAISVDASGQGGRIDGFSFAASGTLDVRNLSISGSLAVLPLVVTPGSDLSGWTVSIDGVEKARNKLRVGSDGRVMIVRPGLIIKFM